MAITVSKQTSVLCDYNCASTDCLKDLMDKIDEKTFVNKLKEHVQINGLTNNQYDLLYKVSESCVNDLIKKK